MCKERYVSPFTDFGFKLLFGTPANKEFLIQLLNALLDTPVPIVNISYNNTEVFGKPPDDRKAVYDLYCTTADSSHIIVEMQNAYQRYFLDRTVYYSSFAMQAAAKKGQWDYRLPPIYTVAFLNFCMDEYADTPAYKHVSKLMDTETNRVFYDKLTYIYIEMPKFDKDIDDLQGHAETWLYIIKNLALLDDKPSVLRGKVFERFFREAEIARFSPEKRLAYETSLKIMRDYNNTVTSAEWKGEVKGRAEGLAEGRAEGRAEGIAEGMDRAKEDIARKLISLGLSDSDIIAATGLSKEEITKLR